MKILFVIHDSSRTGAPLFILGLLDWLKREHKDIEFDILLLRHGELDMEFSNIGKIYFWNYTSINISKKILNKLYPEFHSKSVLSMLKRNNYDLCYVNSVASCWVMKSLVAVLNCPFLLHIHELGFIISDYNDSFKACIPHASHFIGVSNAVKRNLVENYKIFEDKISVIPPVSRPLSDSINEYIDLRKALNLPSDGFIVGLCGTLCWDKGMDLLVPLINKISSENSIPNIFFVWVGEPLDHRYQKMLEYDLARLSLADKVKFVGKTANISGYMAEFDILLLLSREESFSLVAAEANALGKIVVCFEHAIGWTEYVRPDAYITVPYLDIDKMADVIMNISQAERIYVNNKPASPAYAAKKALPELLNLIKNFIK